MSGNPGGIDSTLVPCTGSTIEDNKDRLEEIGCTVPDGSGGSKTCENMDDHAQWRADQRITEACKGDSDPTGCVEQAKEDGLSGCRTGGGDSQWILVEGGCHAVQCRDSSNNPIDGTFGNCPGQGSGTTPETEPTEPEDPPDDTSCTPPSQCPPPCQPWPNCNQNPPPPPPPVPNNGPPTPSAPTVVMTCDGAQFTAQLTGWHYGSSTRRARYEIQYRNAGAASWTSWSGNGTAQARSQLIQMTGSPVTQGSAVELRARVTATWYRNNVWSNWSSWSAWSTFNSPTCPTPPLPAPVVTVCRSFNGIEVTWSLPSSASTTGSGWELTVHSMSADGSTITGNLTSVSYLNPNLIPWNTRSLSIWVALGTRVAVSMNAIDTGPPIVRGATHTSNATGPYSDTSCGISPPPPPPPPPPIRILPTGPSAPIGTAHYTFGQPFVWLDVLSNDTNSSNVLCYDGTTTQSFCAADEATLALSVTSTTPTQPASSMAWSHSSSTRERLGLAFDTPDDWAPADSVTFNYCVQFVGDSAQSCADETLIHGGITAPRNLHQGKLIGPDFFTACWFVPEKNGGAQRGAIRYELQVYANGAWQSASPTYFPTYNADSLTSTLCDNGARVQVGSYQSAVRWRVRAINDRNSASPWATSTATTGPSALQCIARPTIGPGLNALTYATFTTSTPAPAPPGVTHTITLSTLARTISGTFIPQMTFTATGSGSSWSITESSRMSQSDLARYKTALGGWSLFASLSWTTSYGSYTSPSYMSTGTVDGILNRPILTYNPIYGDPLIHPLYTDYHAPSNTCTGADSPPTSPPPPTPDPPVIIPPSDLPTPQVGYWIPGAI